MTMMTNLMVITPFCKQHVTQMAPPSLIDCLHLAKKIPHSVDYSHFGYPLVIYNFLGFFSFCLLGLNVAVWCSTISKTLFSCVHRTVVKSNNFLILKAGHNIFLNIVIIWRIFLGTVKLN